DQMHPRRTMMLRVADEIETLNKSDIDRNAAETRDLFSTYRRVLITVVAATLMLGLALALFSVPRISRLEQESESRFHQVEHAKAELQALSSKLVNAQETERQKLARELHDEVGQGLWAIVLGVGNATAALEDEAPSEAREQLEAVRRTADTL